MSKPERILFFGELLLRMTAPNRELLLQTPRIDVFVGGAEANVAVGLAKLGHNTAMASVLPDNTLGDAIISELRRHGVDTRDVRHGPERVGLYWLTPGAGLRASEIVYDRCHSAFCLAKADLFDWAAMMQDITHLHLSGITPALGAETAKAALAAARAARDAGIPVSFDGNYRARLWTRWDSNPAAILGELLSCTDYFFGNHMDIALILGRSFESTGEDRRREAADAAFEAFPQLKLMASTARQVDDADTHRIAARIDTRTGHWQTDEIVVAGIVDRIGGGDAFAAGVLHALLSGEDEETAARTGLALTCLKHSLPGDASLFTRRDVAAFLEGGLDVRR